MTWGGDKSLALARSCPGTALMSNQWRLFSVVASRTVGPGRSSRLIQRRRSISSGSSLCTPMGSDFTNRCSPLMQRMRETSAPDSPIVCRSIGAPLNVWDHWVGMYILSLTQVLADLLPVGCMTNKTQTKGYRRTSTMGCAALHDRLRSADSVEKVGLPKLPDH